MARTRQQKETGLRMPRTFTQPGQDPADTLAWKTLPVQIKDPDGHVVYDQDHVEVPEPWSQESAVIVAQKYFAREGVPQEDKAGGTAGKTGPETSVRQLVGRVVKTLRQTGEENGYFASEEDAQAFEDELSWLLYHQCFAFNSPVWFNCGRYHAYGQGSESQNWAWEAEADAGAGGLVRVENGYARPQMSACFIQDVQDTIGGEQGILELLQSEARLFKYGSGTGTNFSRIRARGEAVSGGGEASGVMSFLKVLDANAGSIRSGGTTRRAAKMVILDMDHPEIEDFIKWKWQEEEKAKVLIRQGYDPGLEGEAYGTVSGQNSNNSVMVPDRFMEAVDLDGDWTLRERTDGDATRTVKARDLWHTIGEAAWHCADPGVMFSDTIQKWHTCKEDGPIRSTNPCAEYIFLDETSCNLGSLNLLKFLDGDRFDQESFQAAVRVAAIAMDIIVGLGSFPTPRIAQGTHDYRTLGLGYTNAGALLMLMGHPYDSSEGRALMASITSLLCATTYQTSTEMARALGTFPRYEENRQSMLEVMHLHMEAARDLAQTGSPLPDRLPGPEVQDDLARSLAESAQSLWGNVVEEGKAHGFRNAQATVLAPTGTISFMMGAETTGIEPSFALKTYKRLAGGGGMSLPLETLGHALGRLGYEADQVEAIQAHVAQKNTVRGAPHIADEHLPVFASAVDPGGNHLSWKSHLWMVAAVQPFLSGGVSKTINMPESVEVDDVLEAYALAHRLGLKNTAVYRDNCKAVQPLSSGDGTPEAPKSAPAAPADLDEEQVKRLLQEKYPHLAWGYKEPVPHRAPQAYTLQYTVAGVRMHMTLTFVRNGDGRFRLNQVFLNAGDQGDQVFEHQRDLAMTWSAMLRLGTKPADLARKYIGSRGFGGGMTDHPLIKSCTSLKDFVWKLIMLETQGVHDFVNDEVWAQYMKRLDRQPFIHEELAKAAEPGRPATERHITEYMDQGEYEPPTIVDDMRCSTCGAGKEAILVTGTCKTCRSCGHTFGGC